MHGSTYVVWFAKDALPKANEQSLESWRIDASTFLQVEDWAYENVPVGWHLSSIEKHYGTDRELALQGETQVTLS